MPTEEEEKEEIKSALQSSFDSFMNIYYPQLQIYDYARQIAEKLLGDPLTITIRRRRSGMQTAADIMAKVEEFNRAHNERIEKEQEELKEAIENTVMIPAEDVERAITSRGRIVGNGEEGRVEITLDDLLKELEEEGEESIFDRGQRIHREAAANAIRGGPNVFERRPLRYVPTGSVFLAHQRGGAQRRPNETDEEFRERLEEVQRQRGRNRTIPSIEIAYPWYGDFHVGTRNLCSLCSREGCTTKDGEKGECDGFVPKPPPEPVYCVICNDELHEPGNFPEDYPKMLMTCCYCLEAWQYINGFEIKETYLNEEELKTRATEYQQKLEEVFGIA